MCEPTTILAAGSAALQAGSSIANYSAENQQKKAVKGAARSALMEDLHSLTLRGQQEQDAGAQTTMQTDQAARIANGLGAASVAGAGVCGVSVDAMLADIDRQRTTANLATQRNTSAVAQQIAQEKKGSYATYQNRVNSATGGNPLQLGMGVASAGLNLGSFLINNRPKPSGNGNG